MHLFERLVRHFSILCFLAVLYSVSLQASSIIDLGTLGGDEAIANDINNKGQIVGRAKTAAGIFHPFLYSGGQMTDLLPGEPRDGFAEGINDAGQIAGSIPINRTGTSSYDPALYTGGKWVDISISGGGGAHAINDAGEIVGGDRHGRPFLYSRGQVTYFAGGYGGTATAINNRGQIVGSSDFGGSFPDGHAFLYTAGQLMDLGTPFHYFASRASSINNVGDLVGDYYDPLYNTISGGFLYADGKITSFSSDPASPSDINDLGEIVGAVGVGANQYCTSRECPEAFLYSHGVMTNLNSLLPDGSDWELLSATAINDKGQIVGFGYRPVPVPPIDPPQYVTRAFLLDTTPEPATLLLMGVGLVGLALMRRSVMHPNQDASVAACDR